MTLALKNFNGYMLIGKKIGVYAPLWNWFLNSGGTVKYVNGEVTLHISEIPGPAAVAMTIAHIQVANLGTMAKHVKVDYQTKFTVALQNLQDKALLALNQVGHDYVVFGQAGTKAVTSEGWGGVTSSQDGSPQETSVQSDTLYGLPPIMPANVVVSKTVWTPNKGFAAQKTYTDADLGLSFDNLKQVEVAALGSATPLPPVVVEAAKWQTFPFNELTTAALVPLFQATRMYQPVKATTGGKRYYVIALAKHYRVAAKYHGHELSIRVESPQWSEAHKLLKPFFGGSLDDKGYASVHLEAVDDMMAAKALGAVLMGMGAPLETPLPNLQVIKGK